jgi:hypothetical protein
MNIKRGKTLKKKRVWMFVIGEWIGEDKEWMLRNRLSNR